ncbi:MAG TPA: calcium-binding protein, partial [Candidatus Omnitrophota bacterium]|nr:calcium-binding protein [Candidatus Omnitrophota bacterium]
YIRVYEEAAPHSSQPGPVTGAAPTNTILGTNAANVINGTSGHDRIDGKAGADTMAGKGGSDTYVVETMGDKVVEYSGQGIDTVFSSLGFRLGAYMENLTLTGTANVNGTGSNWHNHLTGNDGANALYGLGGNDRLTGGKGADVLTGGAGHDTFVFRSKADAGDRILDFDTAHDRLDVRQLLASIGSTSKDPLADNLLAIRQEGADAVLMVTQPGTQAVRLATVEKVDAHLLAATSDHWTV